MSAKLDQKVRTSLARADRRSERVAFRKRMLIKLRLDAAMPEIKRRYEAGESMQQLADSLNTSPHAIRRRLIRLGVPSKPRHRYKQAHCAKCPRPTKGLSPYCKFHWKLRRAEIGYNYFLRKKAKARGA